MSTLVVKHLPSVLSDDSITEFFQHYGAVDVKIMQGKMKGSVFVTFRDAEEAKRGLVQLQGLKFLDKVLSAELAKDKQTESEEPVVKHEPGSPARTEEEKEKEKPQQFEPIAPSLGVSYPPNPYLEYRYPNPNPLILTNIVNAMTSRPKFYIQVLHLMNKMNLPPPFGPPAPALPLQPEVGKRKRAGGIEEEEESEESDEENAPAPLKRVATGAALAQQLIPQQQQILTQQLIQQQQIQQQINQQLQQRELQAQQQLQQQQAAAAVPVPVPIMPMGGPGVPPMPAAAAAKKPFQMFIQNPQQPGAFPLQPPPQAFLQQQEIPQPIQPQPTPAAPPSKYVTSEEIERNRISMSEIKQTDKKYEKGEPTAKLYIKNLHKNVEISDLERIFGKYFPSEGAMKSGLDIKLMKEGRMKGQAFVTFQDEELAEEALEEVNGYKLHDKPMIIQYGKMK